MEKVATEEAVWKVCEQLMTENHKISGRSVQAETGGSLTTVLQFIKTWRSRDSKNTAMVDISVDVLNALRKALGQTAKETSEALSVLTEEAAEREKEALDALAENESYLAEMEKNLFAAKTQSNELQQLREKESIVAEEAIIGLRNQIGKLEQQKDQHIRNGETARTECHFSRAFTHLFFTPIHPGTAC